MSAALEALEALAAHNQLLNQDDKQDARLRGAEIQRRLGINAPRYNQRSSLPSRWLSKTEAQHEREPWVAVQVRTMKAVTAWLDSMEAEVGPNPQSAGTPEEFVAQLHLLYEWAGKPTLRELEKRAGTGRLPRSSVSDMLRRTGRLPKIDLLTEFVKACGADAALPAWIAAWHRLKRAQIEARR